MIKSISKFVLAAAAVTLGALPAAAQAADKFPQKPITLYVGFQPGGATDVLGRALANIASKHLGQSIVIVNRSGVSGTLAPASVAETAASDGYTLALVAASLVRQPYLSKTRYDTLKDFTYISNVCRYGFAVLVRKESPIQTMAQLVDHARSRPGEVAYGTLNAGGTTNINVERLGRAVGAKFNAIPYPGAAPIFVSLLAGQLDFAAEGGFGPMLEGGKFRALAVFGDNRLVGLEEVPTLKELGYKFDEVESFWGIAGPKGMDPAVVHVLSEAFRQAASDPAFKAEAARQNMTVAFEGPEDFRKTIEKQVRIEAQIAKDFSTLQR